MSQRLHSNRFKVRFLEGLKMTDMLRSSSDRNQFYGSADHHNIEPAGGEEDMSITIGNPL